jgi:hypothetical protein
MNLPAPQRLIVDDGVVPRRACVRSRDSSPPNRFFCPLVRMARCRSSVLAGLVALPGRIRSASGTRLAMNIGFSCQFVHDRDGRGHAG